MLCAAIIWLLNGSNTAMQALAGARHNTPLCVYQNINHFGRVGIQRVWLRCLLAFYRACEFIYVSSTSASWEILSLTLLEKPWQSKVGPIFARAALTSIILPASRSWALETNFICFLTWEHNLINPSNHSLRLSLFHLQPRRLGNWQLRNCHHLSKVRERLGSAGPLIENLTCFRWCKVEKQITFKWINKSSNVADSLWGLLMDFLAGGWSDHTRT
jgi:hypothetical protein